jgi:TolA-binding protein
MRMLLGNARFMQGKYDEATKDYRKYLEDFPQGQFLEEVSYRLAVTQLFNGAFDPALASLNSYLKTYPGGSFVSDARYRLAVCKYATQQYEEVVKDCKSWLASYPNNEQEGEVQALLGDALAAENTLEEAIPAYVRSYKTSNTNEVLNYSLFEASKHMQKLGKWDDVAKLFEEFVREKPGAEAVVAAMFWIGRAKAHQGKIDEAKIFLVETLKKYIEEPKREAVEQLLSQLAQLCVKRPRPTAPEAAAASVEPAPQAASIAAASALATSPVPAPELAPFDAFAELEKQIAPLADTSNSTAKARLLYARAELATLKKRPVEQEKIYREIAERFKPEDLSPVLLAVIGDFLLQKGEAPRAAALFERLKENFPKSDYLDYAYVGLGEIEFARKDYTKALELFTDALDKITASMKTKEATIGKAKTLLELGKYEESKKLFEQVASIREWRGESTAFAIYSLGEIEARQNRLPEAIAHFRRVFVAYQKFLPWVAKAYIRAADSFEKMGKRQDAIENLREMLRNERLEKFPEQQEARRRLQQWGAA